MPIDYKKYPPNWHEISDRIRFQRAGGKCEWCGAPHGEIIVRDPNEPQKFRVVSGMEIDAAILDDEHLTKVVLTTAHLGKPSWRCNKMGCQLQGVVLNPDFRHFDGAALCPECFNFLESIPGDKTDLADVRDENLAALCQRCHLLEDLKDRLLKRLKTKHEKELSDGQLFLSDE